MPKFILIDDRFGPGLYTFECPGCECSHYVRTQPDPNDAEAYVWTWNGDVDSPTVSPSLFVNRGNKNPNTPVCHSFIKAGNIRYLGDCSHNLKSSTVPIPDQD